uniref:Uncharacterized protein n=1 Tax=Rhizophora mucronata TaxID=61149 RepID=A0A2P2QW77_RHIMU
MHRFSNFYSSLLDINFPLYSLKLHAALLSIYVIMDKFIFSLSHSLSSLDFFGFLLKFKKCVWLFFLKGHFPS